MRRFKLFLVIVLASGLGWLFWAYFYESESHFEPGGGVVHVLDLPALGPAIAIPQIYWSPQDPGILAVVMPSSAHQTRVQAAIVILASASTRFDTLDARLFETYTLLNQSVGAHNEIPIVATWNPQRSAYAVAEYSGIHMRLPLFRAFGFPERAPRDWILLDRYSGSLEIRVFVDGDDESIARVHKTLVNASRIPTLNEYGFWTPDGRYFLIPDNSDGRQSLVVMSVATKE